MAKVFTYRGHGIEDLRKMSLDEVVGVMPSRIRRSLKRGFSDKQKKLLESVREKRKAIEKGEKNPKPILTHCRNMPIIPEMVGLRFKIYTGKEFAQIDVIPEMIGHYLGEFAQTRAHVKHSAPGVGATRSSLFVPVK